jgi:hypothetical protein
MMRATQWTGDALLARQNLPSDHNSVGGQGALIQAVHTDTGTGARRNTVA